MKRINRFTQKLLCTGGLVAMLASLQISAQSINFSNTTSPVGGDNRNRTKDAHIADIDQNGTQDIFDANSSGSGNTTGMVIRFANPGTSTFNVVSLESRDLGAITYDADLIDLNNDNYPDLIRTTSGNPNTPIDIEIFYNKKGLGSSNDQNRWFDTLLPDQTIRINHCADDIAVGDLNNDGFLDFAVTGRTRAGCNNTRVGGEVSVFLNDQGRSFNFSDVFIAPINVSTHDVFFLDIENDGDLDFIAVNESNRNVSEPNRSRLYVNDGDANFSRNSATFVSGFTGEAFDFNRDGYDDFVIAGRDNVDVLMNNPSSPGRFTLRDPNTTTDNIGAIYDVELGDFNSVGDVDIFAGSISEEAAVWLNNGNLTRPFISPDTLGGTFPQLLSADALDFDSDGDLDIYLTGPDGGPGQPNQLRRNNINISRFDNDNIITFADFEGNVAPWENDSDDSDEWILNSGTTTSSNTGPSRASSGSEYIYFETSNGSANTRGDSASLTSPNVSGINRYLVFDYHMFGSDIGTLYVDVFHRNRWEEAIFSLTGQQQASSGAAWRNAHVDLSRFNGNIRVRLRAVADGDFRGDIALDNVAIDGNRVTEVQENPPQPDPEPELACFLDNNSYIEVTQIDTSDRGRGDNDVTESVAQEWRFQGVVVFEDIDRTTSNFGPVLENIPGFERGPSNITVNEGASFEIRRFEICRI